MLCFACSSLEFTFIGHTIKVWEWGKSAMHEYVVANSRTGSWKGIKKMVCMFAISHEKTENILFLFIAHTLEFFFLGFHKVTNVSCVSFAVASSSRLRPWQTSKLIKYYKMQSKGSGMSLMPLPSIGKCLGVISSLTCNGDRLWDCGLSLQCFLSRCNPCKPTV